MNPARLRQLTHTPRANIERLGEKPYFFMPRTRRNWIDAMTNGQLVLQCVVQANQALYDADNKESAPGVVIYTTDRTRCLDGGFLYTVAEQVQWVKRDPYPRDTELQDVQRLLLDERSWFKIILPPALTWGVPTVMMVTAMMPQELPGGCIPPHRLIPCIIADNGDLWHLKPSAYQ